MNNGSDYDLYFRVNKDDVVWCKLDTPTSNCGPFDALQIVSIRATLEVEN